ncbi:MAG: hypothetical protein QOF84_595 [Streptomyces sp.]|jgi:hypothetical protein|nr:hypothetical protein [Streptomyces sp.]
MTDLPSSPDTSSAAGGPGRGSAPSTPRWVKVSGIIAGVLVLAFVVMHLAGGGMDGHH